MKQYLGSEEVGGEELGGSKRSERPEAELGEKGESWSRSMSMGEEEAAEVSSAAGGLGVLGWGPGPWTGGEETRELLEFAGQCRRHVGRETGVERGPGARGER